MIRRVLHRLSGRLPVRIIRVQNAPYLERYLLAELPEGGCLYLHRFLSSDPDRGYHNHPWRSLSLILAGGYIEHRWISGGDVAVRMAPGGVNRITPERYHRVELLGSEA